jgi:hypothetical protein
LTAPLLLSRSEIDDRRWNELIALSEQQVIYGYTAYLDLVCDQWKALVWPSVGEYRIVMPIPIKQKWGKDVVQKPLFCQYLGVFSAEPVHEIQIFQFLEKLSSHYSYISSYHFHPANSPLLKENLRSIPQFLVQENQTYWLSLEDSYSKIKDRYRTDRKVNLKRSLVLNWDLRKCDDPLPLIDLFKKHHAGKIAGGVNRSAYGLLEQLFQTLHSNHKAKLWYATHNGQIHAGAIFVRSGGRVIYLFNAADRFGREGNARTFLLDRYFQENAGKALIFDFESPEVDSIAAFYSSFGAEKVPYYVIRKNDLPFPFRQIQRWRMKSLLKTTRVPSLGF